MLQKPKAIALERLVKKSRLALVKKRMFEHVMGELNFVIDQQDLLKQLPLEYH